MREGRSTPKLANAVVELEHRPAFLIQHGEAMGAVGLKAGTSSHYAIVERLWEREKQSIALSIFLASLMKFERMQAGLPFSLFISSGFSAEDLTSNLGGFYAALYHIPGAQLREICGEVSVEESYRIWDTYLPGGLGALKRHSATPLLFPTKEGVRSKADLTFPPQFMTVPITPPGTKWVQVMESTDIDRLVRLKASIDIASNGQPGVTGGSIAMP